MTDLQRCDFDNTCKHKCPPQVVNNAFPKCYKCGRSLKELVRFDKAQSEKTS